MPLSVVDLAVRDNRFVETLRHEGAAHDWAVCPFIHTPEAATFAASRGLPVHGISERVLAGEVLPRLNDTYSCQQACRRLRRVARWIGWSPRVQLSSRWRIARREDARRRGSFHGQEQWCHADLTP